MKQILNFINGQYVSNVSGKTYEKRNPVDNSLIGMVHEAGQPEVDAAVAAARAALRTKANEELAAMVRAETTDALNKVLFELSSGMKNAYSRSDA